VGALGRYCPAAAHSSFALLRVSCVSASSAVSSAPGKQLCEVQSPQVRDPLMDVWLLALIVVGELDGWAVPR